MHHTKLQHKRASCPSGMKYATQTQVFQSQLQNLFTTYYQSVLINVQHAISVVVTLVFSEFRLVTLQHINKASA